MKDEKTNIHKSFSASPTPGPHAVVCAVKALRSREQDSPEGELEREQPGGFQSITPRALLPATGAGAARWGRLSTRPGSEGEKRDGKAPLWSVRNYRLEYQNSPSVIASNQSAQPGGRVSVTREQWITARSQRGRTAPCLHRSWAGLASSPPLPRC